MEFVTIEDRVDRLEALFGQFITEMAVINKRAEERNKAAEERMTRFEQEMRADRMAMSQEMHKDREALSQEMQAFKEEMRADRKAMNKQWGDLANKLGTIIEDIVAPNLRRLATEYFGFAEVRECMIRWNRKKPNAPSAWEEFDVVVAGPEAVIVGEAKSSMNIEYRSGWGVRREAQGFQRIRAASGVAAGYPRGRLLVDSPQGDRPPFRIGHLRHVHGRGDDGNR